MADEANSEQSSVSHYVKFSAEEDGILRKLAKESDRSMSYVIRDLVRKSLNGTRKARKSSLKN